MITGLFLIASEESPPVPLNKLYSSTDRFESFSSLSPSPSSTVQDDDLPRDSIIDISLSSTCNNSNEETTKAQLKDHRFSLRKSDHELKSHSIGERSQTTTNLSSDFNDDIIYLSHSTSQVQQDSNNCLLVSNSVVDYYASEQEMKEEHNDKNPMTPSNLFKENPPARHSADEMLFSSDVTCLRTETRTKKEPIESTDSSIIEIDTMNSLPLSITQFNPEETHAPSSLFLPQDREEPLSTPAFPTPPSSFFLSGKETPSASIVKHINELQSPEEVSPLPTEVDIHDETSKKWKNPSKGYRSNSVQCVSDYDLMDPIPLQQCNSVASGLSGLEAKNKVVFSKAKSANVSLCSAATTSVNQSSSSLLQSSTVSSDNGFKRRTTSKNSSGSSCCSSEEINTSGCLLGEENKRKSKRLVRTKELQKSIGKQNNSFLSLEDDSRKLKRHSTRVPNTKNDMEDKNEKQIHDIIFVAKFNIDPYALKESYFINVELQVFLLIFQNIL